MKNLIVLGAVAGLFFWFGRKQALAKSITAFAQKK